MPPHEHKADHIHTAGGRTQAQEPTSTQAFKLPETCRPGDLNLLDVDLFKLPGCGHACRTSVHGDCTAGGYVLVFQ